MLTFNKLLSETVGQSDELSVKLMQNADFLTFGEKGETKNVKVLHILHGKVHLELIEDDEFRGTLRDIRSMKEYNPTGEEPFVFEDYDWADEPSYYVTCTDMKLNADALYLLY